MDDVYFEFENRFKLKDFIFPPASNMYFYRFIKKPKKYGGICHDDGSLRFGLQLNISSPIKGDKCNSCLHFKPIKGKKEYILEKELYSYKISIHEYYCKKIRCRVVRRKFLIDTFKDPSNGIEHCSPPSLRIPQELLYFLEKYPDIVMKDYNICIFPKRSRKFGRIILGEIVQENDCRYLPINLFNKIMADGIPNDFGKTTNLQKKTKLQLIEQTPRIINSAGFFMLL